MADLSLRSTLGSFMSLASHPREFLKEIFQANFSALKVKLLSSENKSAEIFAHRRFTYEMIE